MPTYNDYLIFEGISVDEQGKQYYLDVHVAYRQACLNAIEYLKKFGYSREQAYAILGTAPFEGHISGIVDIPNACATLWLPTEIFAFDIMPSAAGPMKHVWAASTCRCRPTSDQASRQGATDAGSTTISAAAVAPSPPCGRWRNASSRTRARVAGAQRSAAFLTAPYFSAMPAERRRAHATNERSAHAPSSLAQMKAAHGAGCSCCGAKSMRNSKRGKNGAKSFPAARPWMISH